MKSIDVVGMFKTVASVAPLGDNKFRVKYGRNEEAIITIEAAQHSVHRIGLLCACGGMNPPDSVSCGWCGIAIPANR